MNRMKNLRKTDYAEDDLNDLDSGKDHDVQHTARLTDRNN